MEDCTVCFNAYTSSNKRISCSFCSYDSCRKCVEKYIDISGKQTCMNCGKEWTLKFLYNHLAKTFIKDVYIPKKKSELADILRDEIPDIHRKYTMKELIKSARKELLELKREFYAKKSDIESRIRDLLNSTTESQPGEKERHRACPVEECRGMLENYVCGLCSTKVCKSCDCLMDDEHKCDAHIVENLNYLKKSHKDKPCPKCGMYISKISGCDQMYCLKCNTAWSWKNGTIEKGVIHNPHYYEYIRSTGREALRNVGDVPCGGLVEWRFVMAKLSFKDRRVMESIHRSIGHMLEVINKIRGNLPNIYVKHTERYLLGHIDEKTWKTLLYKKYKELQTKLIYIGIIETFTTIGIERFRAIRTRTVDPKEATREMVKLLSYCNENIAELQKTFSLSDRTISTIDVDNAYPESNN